MQAFLDAYKLMVNVMANTAGRWIADALDLERRLSALPAAKRRNAYKTEARDLRIETMRRQIPAALFAEKHARSVGLSVLQVSAAAIAIQALMRFEKLDLEAALKIRGDVFQGKISAREMVAIAKNAVPVGGPIEHDLRWDQFVVAVSQAIDPEFSRTAYGHGFSNAGKLTCVDMEVVSGPAAMRSAVFFGPASIYSAFRNKGLTAQIPYLFMAGAFYDKVGFYYCSSNEFEIVSKVLTQARDSHRVVLFDLNSIVGTARRENEL